MNAKDCPCEVCQKHAPLYPYFILPVPSKNGFSRPRVVMQFHETDIDAMQAALKFAPVYEWRMMTHEQTASMYSGEGFQR